MAHGNIIPVFSGAVRAVAGFVARSDRAYGGPVSAFIEPANVCNLKCPLCASGSGSLERSRGVMKIDDFTRIVDRLPASVGTLYLWGQGEPFLAPDFLAMVSYVSSRGIRTVTSTNGHFLSDPRGIIESGLDTLIVSLDGVDQVSYETYRIDGDFDTVVHGINGLVKEKRRAKRGPLIELQYLVTKTSLNTIAVFKRLAAEAGADRVVFKTLQAVSMHGDDSLPENLKLTRYRRTSEGRLIPDRWRLFENRCLRIYYSLQIDWRGNVLPCCFDKDSDFIMGNLLDVPFSAIWNGDSFRSFRLSHALKGRVHRICRDCTEGLKRIALDL